MSGWKSETGLRSVRHASGGRCRKIFRACSALVGLALLAGCARPHPLQDTNVRVLRISQRNEPADLDPATASLPDELFVIRALSEGLVAPTPRQGPPAPAAAASWERSADGLTYTFHLRPDGRWSNGEPVTTADFVDSYRRVLTPATAAPKAPLLFMVRNARAFARGELGDFSAVGFRAADAHTLVVTLEHPMPRFLLYVASGPWIPVNPRVVARLGRDWTRPENFVGNGAFTLTEWRPHQRIVVRKNPGYHDAAHVRLDEIQFIAFDSEGTEERAFRSRQVEVTMAIPYSKLDAYRTDPSGEAHRAPLAETRYLAFNTQRPPLNDVRVRRALALALDRAQLVAKVLHGGQEPAYRLVPAALRSAEDRATHLDETLSENAADARTLLAAAGFPGGRGFPTLELSSWPVGAPIGEVIQATWRKELGIDITLLTREARVHVAALRSGNYAIAFITAIPDVPDSADLLGDFVSGAPGNYPHWSDGRFDALMAAANRSAQAGAQDALLREAETRLLDQCPLTPLYFNTTNWLMRASVHGWQQDALWTRFYQDIFLEEKK